MPVKRQQKLKIQPSRCFAVNLGNLQASVQEAGKSSGELCVEPSPQKMYLVWNQFRNVRMIKGTDGQACPEV